ncbi:MAG TPA: FAD-dependent oxidoreductase [Candidatus Limnocylindrales bacterium]|nr:FAD-dependent oxidoreductase [Candidatus Limnocylindrales bacterium]
MSRNGQSTSIWMSVSNPRHPALTNDVFADVCVIGGGIAGMTTAYLLVQEGRSVVLIDDGPVASGQTERTTAHLSNAIDARYFEIERLHGEEGARLTAESHSAAIDCIESIVAQESIDCGFERVDGYLFLAPEHSTDLLEKELAAAHRAGLTQVEKLDRADFDKFETGPCLRFPRQGQFHPLQYLSAVAEAIVRKGGRIFSDTKATEITGGKPARVRTAAGSTVTCEAVVVATNTPINDRVAIHTKQAPYRTYVITAKVPARSVPNALFWDTHDPYHYIRLFRSGGGQGSQENESGFDTIIIGGEDHKTGQNHEPEECFGRLEDWARERFPITGHVEHCWSGQVWETVDGLGFIGRNPMDSDNVYISTGDCGMGMTHGTIAGMLLTDLIQGRDNVWSTLYDPTRKNIKAAMEYAKENTNVAWQYTDWLTPGEVSSAGEVAPGHGAIMRCGLSKVAVYRDDSSSVCELSAVCTHLGGIVQWNSAEHTWDCPVHGSRFEARGRVVTGPANSDLAPHEHPQPDAAPPREQQQYQPPFDRHREGPETARDRSGQ